MKNLKYFWLAFGFIFCLGLVNCDDKGKEEDCVECGNDDDDDDENPENPIIEPETYKIDGAEFKTSELPDGDADIVDIATNNYIINGGSSIVSFISDEELKYAYIAMEGIEGHYICELREVSSEVETRADAGKHTYQIIIHFGQHLTEGGFKLKIAVETIDGVISRIFTREYLTIEAEIGDLQISLSWDQFDDLDLHVFDPLDNHIYYGNAHLFSNGHSEEKVVFEFYYEWFLKNFSIDISSLDISKEEDMDILIEYLEEYGEPDYTEYLEFIEGKEYSFNARLDIDSNAGCDIDAKNNENIYFINPVPGVYKIAVDLWQKCDGRTPGSTYSVRLIYKGRTIKFSNRQVGSFPASDLGTFNEGPYRIIGEFVVENNGTRSVPKQVNPTVQKLKNRLFTK